MPDRYVHTSALSDEGFGQQSCDRTIVAVKMMYENFRHTHGSGSGAGEINVEPGSFFLWLHGVVVSSIFHLYVI